MSDHDCPCCRVYGPIPKSEKITRAERRAIKKEAEENIKRLKRENPEAYKDLVNSLKALTSRATHR